MQFSVQCGEEVQFSSPGEFAAAAQAYPETQNLFDSSPNLGEPIFTICEIWGAKEADPIENESVSNDIPRLVLAGEYDPITSPAWGEMVAENLSSGFYCELPGVGHGASITGEECPLSIALAFPDKSTIQPDGSRVAEMSGPDFLFLKRMLGWCLSPTRPSALVALGPKAGSNCCQVRIRGLS